MYTSRNNEKYSDVNLDAPDSGNEPSFRVMNPHQRC